MGTTAQSAEPFNSPETTETVTGLANGTAYTFTAAAINAVGPSPASSASNAVTPTPPSISEVLNPSAAQYGVGQSVSFSLAISNPGGGPTLTVSSLSQPLPSTLAASGPVLTFDGQTCPSPGVTCSLTGNAVPTAGFTVAAGQTHTIAFNAVAVGTPGNCSSSAPTVSASTNAGTLQASVSLPICASELALQCLCP